MMPEEQSDLALDLVEELSIKRYVVRWALLRMGGCSIVQTWCYC